MSLNIIDYKNLCDELLTDSEIPSKFKRLILPGMTEKDYKNIIYIFIPFISVTLKSSDYVQDSFGLNSPVLLLDFIFAHKKIPIAQEAFGDTIADFASFGQWRIDTRINQSPIFGSTKIASARLLKFDTNLSGVEKTSSGTMLYPCVRFSLELYLSSLYNEDINIFEEDRFKF